MVTPSRLLPMSPDVMMTNRVVRQFGAENALRIVYRDENGQKLKVNDFGQDRQFFLVFHLIIHTFTLCRMRTAKQSFQEWLWSLKTHIQIPLWFIEIRVGQKILHLSICLHDCSLCYIALAIPSCDILRRFFRVYCCPLALWGVLKSFQTSSSSYFIVAVSQFLNCSLPEMAPLLIDMVKNTMDKKVTICGRDYQFLAWSNSQVGKEIIHRRLPHEMIARWIASNRYLTRLLKMNLKRKNML